MEQLPKFVVVEKYFFSSGIPENKVYDETENERLKKIQKDQEQILPLTAPLFLKKLNETEDSIIESFKKKQLYTHVSSPKIKESHQQMTRYAYEIQTDQLEIKIYNLLGRKEIKSLDLSKYSLKNYNFEGSQETSYLEKFIFERITPDSASAGGGSRKSRRKVRKSRRSKAKKSRRRTRK